jgi:hypothetical protein
MFIDQITPHFPKNNEEVNAHVKRLQVMLDATTVVDPVHDQEDDDRGHEDDHQQSPVGTHPTTSLHWRSTVEGMVETTTTCATSSATGMHVARLKIGAECRSALNNVMKGTIIIMVPSTTNLNGSAPQKEGTFHEVSMLIPET